MSVIPEHFNLKFRAVANPDAVLQLGNARFTMFSQRLIRMEYHPDGKFEDRATQTFWYREQPVPEFSYRCNDNILEIETEYLYLNYQETGEAFNKNNLSIDLKSTFVQWQAQLEDSENLLGTIRTLDVVNGYTPLSKGLISRSGWAVLDDSKSLVFNEDSWLAERDPNAIDWYFLGYGHDYKSCLQDYCKVSGQMPLIPRWILGNWWSRYWAYTQEELTQLVKDFEAYDIPLSVCIVDMDWHITETGNDSSGWTGYTWNRELFPEPKEFLDFLHSKGLRTALNLHPAEGVHPHEEQYPAMAERLGIDPQSSKPIPFNITDPEFANAYFEELHHPYEAMGVDFWWIDWQQGQSSPMKGLDPLWLINHLHFYDSGRDGQKRPFIFSRWGNQGHQRYPIGFSGDSYITWDSLRFQPYMTATASNVAYGWWSHDIGGHISGTGDNELFVRWLQFGVFSPIMRIHTTKGYFYERRPWMLGDTEILNNLREVMQLRHQLIPYIYTMAQRAHQESLPLLLPMYYDYPEEEAAYHCPQQYLFGTELLAAPFVEPIDADTCLSRQVVWLPEGDWYHFFTGEHFTGNSWQAIYGTLQEIPLFAKAGALIPLGAWNYQESPYDLEVHIFAGADNRFVLYEDDGATTAYQAGHFAKTAMEQHFSEKKLEFKLFPAEGDKQIVPDSRNVSFAIHGISDACSVRLEVGGKNTATTAQYNEDTETMYIEAVDLPTNEAVLLIAETSESSLLARRNRRGEKLLEMLGHFRLHTGIRNKVADNIEQILDNPEAIAPLLIAMTSSQIQALCESLFSAGVQFVKDTHNPTLLLVWNNNADKQISYRYSDVYLYFGMVWDNHFSKGIAPKFEAIVPKMKTWSHGAMQEKVQTTQWSIQLDYHNIATVSYRHKEETP